MFLLSENRMEEIKSKGFDMSLNREVDEHYVPTNPADYAAIKVGLKKLDNALTDINFYKKINPKADKETILKNIKNNNIAEMREISEFFYKTSGMYARLCRYMAGIYRFDYVVNPVVLDKSIKDTKIIEGFFKSLVYLDEFNVKRNFMDIALKVVVQGAFYGYKKIEGTRVDIQELPATYCRSRFFSNGKPVLEFNMRYFDAAFPDTAMRMKMLKIFPSEFAKGYLLFKQGKLTPDFQGDEQGWYMLDVKNTVKFNLNNADYPMFVSVITKIIDLEEANVLDRKKMEQQLIKLIIQKMPLDKNGELIFDVDEAKALHNNVVQMLGKAIGLDVLTTFAEVEVADLSSRESATAADELEKVERGVFNEAGVSQMQFNTAGNLALEKSLLNDEASMKSLHTQFEALLNELLEPFNKNRKKLYFKAQLLETTIYNFKDLSKLYKEQMQIGFSKFFAQVALGQSQLSILSNAYFENEVLDLNALFMPPAMSSTVSGGDAGGAKKEVKAAGRPEKPDEEKTEKTIQNKESMS